MLLFVPRLSWATRTSPGSSYRPRPDRHPRRLLCLAIWWVTPPARRWFTWPQAHDDRPGRGGAFRRLEAEVPTLPMPDAGSGVAGGQRTARSASARTAAPIRIGSQRRRGGRTVSRTVTGMPSGWVAIRGRTVAMTTAPGLWVQIGDQFLRCEEEVRQVRPRNHADVTVVMREHDETRPARQMRPERHGTSRRVPDGRWTNDARTRSNDPGSGAHVSRSCCSQRVRRRAPPPGRMPQHGSAPPVTHPLSVTSPPALGEPERPRPRRTRRPGHARGRDPGSPRRARR